MASAIGDATALTQAQLSQIVVGNMLRAGLCAGGSIGADTNVCPQSEAEPPVEVTSALARRAFRQVRLPESELVIQPPGGKTLVNFETLFRTEAEAFVTTVRLLGRRVDLRITPTAFTWTTGDGRSFTTDEPGRRYERGLPMEAYVWHEYVDAHVTVHPSVATTWAAEFRVDGGAWRPVDGSVTIAGQAGNLRVVEARPALVAYR